MKRFLWLLTAFVMFFSYGTVQAAKPSALGAAKEYTHNSRFDDCIVRKGIDVSSYQHEIDWDAVKADGIEFAIIRVGFRGDTDGNLGEDPYAKRNLAAAVDAGLEVGIYIFSQAITEQEAKEEAAYALRIAKGFQVTLPVVMDFEYTSKSNGRLLCANLTSAQATRIVNAFAGQVRNAGYEPMVYANKYMLENKLNAHELKCKVWLAHWVSSTSYQGDYEFWQYTSEGAVNGINGNVDCDFWYDKAALKVTYKANGAAGSDMLCVYAPNESFTIAKNPYKYKGYTFQGWNTEADGSGTAYKAGKYLKSIKKDLTLYAQWKPVKYVITYELNGGTNHRKNPSKYDVTSKKIVLQDPIREGYTFGGWYKNKKCTVSAKTIKAGSTGDRTFYAKWIPNKYKIKFNGNQATGGSMKNMKSCKPDVTYRLTKNEFVREGYVFKGWNTERDGSGTSYKDGAKVINLGRKQGDVIVLYAQWKKIK